MNGILLLDKPVGITSNAALGRAKKILGIRKAGHTGSLDPLATGLLPLCFGEATKVSAWLLDSDKTYLAEIFLGRTTASGDADGEITGEAPVPGLSMHEVESVLGEFRGEIKQVPPMHSALKQGGVRLHELARRGIEVERQPRRVIIHALELRGLDLPRILIEVRCSKGTYIRTLAMDIGARIGCGAHLSALRRTASGPFRLADAVTLDELEAMDRESASALLLPPDAALCDWPALDLDVNEATRIRHGQILAWPGNQHDGPVRLYHGGIFIGIGEMDAGRLRPRRLFAL